MGMIGTPNYKASLNYDLKFFFLQGGLNSGGENDDVSPFFGGRGGFWRSNFLPRRATKLWPH